MNDQIIVDSNVLIALFDEKDFHSPKAIKLLELIDKNNVDTLIPDCVINEAFSAIGRRLIQKDRKADVRPTFFKMEAFLKPANIFWAYSYMKVILPNVLSFMNEFDGAVSFHDALIALVMKQEGLKYILSFDRHFDLFPWLTRIYEPEQLAIHLSDV